MRAGTFFRHKSLTKNWPGGRRKATVIVSVGEDRSVPVWNTAIVQLARPYTQAEGNKMVQTIPGDPDPCDSSSTTPSTTS